MTTQQRLDIFRQQLQQEIAAERQVLGQISDLENQARSIHDRKMALNGAIQALEAVHQHEEMAKQQVAETTETDND
ncbi:MAG: hypothetical protein KDE53_21445 [Caldilineaceae bacterium]|nr:hypothetical protein [Caldilineaceae bacterium]